MPQTIASRGERRSVRIFEIVVALGTLLALTPVLVMIALAVRSSGRPVFFGQRRLGRGGEPFRLWKFRTIAGTAGATVTPTGDLDVTRIGRVLRRSHLDELPQLVAVLLGDMALVGPRPEVPANLVAVEPRALGHLLEVRPGITGPTQLAFIGEDDVLAEHDEPTTAYRQVLVPAKVRADLEWLARRRWWGDLQTLLRTPWVVVSPTARRRSRERVRRLLER